MAYKIFAKKEIQRVDDFSFYSDQKISDDAYLRSCSKMIIEK